jgi:hypothetical protein
MVPSQARITDNIEVWNASPATPLFIIENFDSKGASHETVRQGKIRDDQRRHDFGSAALCAVRDL